MKEHTIRQIDFSMAQKAESSQLAKGLYVITREGQVIQEKKPVTKQHATTMKMIKMR